MLIKEIHVKNPFTKESIIYKNLDAEDAMELEGFIKVKFMKDFKDFSAGTVAYFNRNIVLKIIPEIIR